MTVHRSFVGILVAVMLTAASVNTSAQPRAVADAGQIALPAIALAMASVSGDKDGVYDFVKSFGATMIVVHALKAGVNAERPNGAGHSFPSGHTAAAFTGSSFVWKRYGWKAGAPATALALAVASSRVDTRDHHIRDVLVGAALATASVMTFTSRRGDATFSVGPTASAGGGGVSASLVW